MNIQEEINKYGVPNWLIEALKPYDSLMSSKNGNIKDSNENNNA